MDFMHEFKAMVAKGDTLPFTSSGYQRMRLNGLFCNLGDEITCNRISIRLNPQSEKNDKNKVSAVLIPGIQGVVSNEWYTFGANLSTPTYIVQLTKSKEATSIEAVTESIFAAVCNCFAKQKQFYIVGYSFGAIIAIQLAQMLERGGKRGRLLLIDGSPAYLKKSFASMMTTSSGTQEANVEDVLIMLMYFNLCNGDQTYDVIYQLKNYDKWSKKLDLLFRYLPDTVTSVYSTQYMRNLFTAMSNRMKIVMEATNTDDGQQMVKLKSLVTLVRPIQATIADIPSDYDLSKYAEQTIVERYVSGNFPQMLSSDEVAEIVDKFAPVE